MKKKSLMVVGVVLVLGFAGIGEAAQEQATFFDGMVWYFSGDNVDGRFDLNAAGELEWRNPWPPDHVIVQLPEQRLSEVGDVVEISYRYKGEGGGGLYSGHGTGDIRTGVFDSNGSCHATLGDLWYHHDCWLGYLGYRVGFSPHANPDGYAGRLAKRIWPFGENDDGWGFSLLQAAEDTYGDNSGQQKIDGFGLPLGQWSQLTIRLERTSPSTVVYTATCNGVTYTLTDDDPKYQPQKIDALGMYFANDRPYDLITFAIPESPQSWTPRPSDGSQGVSTEVELGWGVGSSAVSNDIYLGTSFEGVTSASQASSEYKGNLEAASYNRFNVEGLKLGTTYYWRVDDVTPGETLAGDVWSFTTRPCVAQEDFESFVDDEALEAAWEAAGGGWVELLTDQARGGTNSMKLTYYNRSPETYCGAARTFDEVQNFNSYESFGFYYMGEGGNMDDKLYAVIEDAAGNSSRVVSASNMNLSDTQWQLWSVELTQFAGVDLANVKKIEIGVGDQDGPPSSAIGSLYIDDVGLCGGGGGGGCPCFGNLNADDQVDLDDLQAVAGILLDAGSPFVVEVEAGHCGNMNDDLQIDLEDLQAVAGILLDAGSPFIAPCE